MNIREKLMHIQGELKAPKSNFNSFGKYHYRSTEDILEGLKPLLKEYKATLTIADDIIQVGDRYYVKATATLIDTAEGESISAVAYAREDENKKGMDTAQVTGSTSSYARKYALNGLFAIDDTKDSDYTNKHGKDETDKGKQNHTAQNRGNNRQTLNKPKTITKAQAQTLFEVAKGDVEVVREVLSAFGYKNSTDVPVDKLSQVTKVIEDTFKAKVGLPFE